MIIVGNSHVSVFRGGRLMVEGTREAVNIHWVGALEINHFFDDHPAATRIRCLFEGEPGWKLLLLGNHDIFRLIELSQKYSPHQAFEFLQGRYRQVFLELKEKGNFAWMIGLQQTKNVHFEGFGPEAIAELAQAFNRALKEWCLGVGIPVIDPLPHILGEDGLPRRELLRDDELHLKPSSASVYFGEMARVLGERLVFSEEWAGLEREPKSEPESFCALLCEELGIPQRNNGGLSLPKLEEKLLAFAQTRLQDRGISLALTRESELASSGLFDSLDLVEFFTHALDLMGTDLFFEVDLRELDSVAKLGAFLWAKREAPISLCREDFNLSMEGGADHVSVLAAESRIAALPEDSYENLKEVLKVVAPGGLSYGIVYFWMALLEERRGRIAQAFLLLDRAEDEGIPFPFRDSRLTEYRDRWQGRHPKEANAWFLEKGEALCEKEDFAGARAIFGRLIQQEPPSPEALNNLGVLDFQENRLERALSYFERALQISPDDPDTRENQALVRQAIQASKG